MSKILYGAFIILSATSCSSDNVPSTIKAKVVTPIGSTYEYDVVTIESLNDVKSMKGTYVELRGGGELDLSQDVDEIVKSSDPDQIYKSTGDNFSLNYFVEDDVVVAKDFTSLAALTIYHNYEYIFNFWETHFGITVDDFGKLTIYNNPKLNFEEDELSVTVEVKVNAAFLPGARDFWLFKKSSDSLIPLKMNRGVLAHEFSHAIFDEIFTDRNISIYTAAQPLNEYMLSAINEGVADYYAYMVTGRVDDFALSLKEVGDQRTLPVSWTLSNVLTSICIESFYCEGSILASSLYEISQSLVGKYDAPAVTVGQAVFDALSSDSFKTQWAQLKDSGTFLYSHLLVEIKNRADPSDTTVYCDSFKKWFDDVNEITHLEANGC